MISIWCFDLRIESCSAIKKWCFLQWFWWNLWSCWFGVRWRIKIKIWCFDYLVRKRKFNRNERCGFGKLYLQSERNNMKKIWTKVTELKRSRFCNQLCHSLIEVFAVISQFRNLKSDDRNEWNWDWSYLWVNLKVKITIWFFCERSRYKKNWTCAWIQGLTLIRICS